MQQMHKILWDEGLRFAMLGRSLFLATTSVNTCMRQMNSVVIISQNSYFPVCMFASNTEIWGRGCLLFCVLKSSSFIVYVCKKELLRLINTNHDQKEFKY
jgi:hypothetical protein